MPNHVGPALAPSRADRRIPGRTGAGGQAERRGRYYAGQVDVFRAEAPLEVEIDLLALGTVDACIQVYFGVGVHGWFG